MPAYKWLQPGAVDPDTGAIWSTDGWAPMRRMFSKKRSVAYPPEDLAATLESELWEIETEGKVEAYHHTKTLKPGGFTAKRGRLVRRIDAWNDEAAGDVGKDSILRTRDLLAEAMGAVADLGLGDPAALREIARPLAAAQTRADIEAAAACFEDLPKPTRPVAEVPVVAVTGLRSTGLMLWEAATAVMTDPPAKAAKLAVKARAMAAGRSVFADAAKAGETDFNAVWARVMTAGFAERRLLAASLRQRLEL